MRDTMSKDNKTNFLLTPTYSSDMMANSQDEKKNFLTEKKRNCRYQMRGKQLKTQGRRNQWGSARRFVLPVSFPVGLLVYPPERKLAKRTFVHCTYCNKTPKNNKVIKFKNNRGQKSSFLGQNMSQNIF